MIPELEQAVREHPYPLLFATVSGAHLYGFPSPDSDYDLRGAHILPAEETMGLYAERDTKHDELKTIAQGCLTRHHAHHYFGFAANQWELFQKEEPPRVKPLLYVFRVLLTGIHLMRTGRIEANLVRLNEEYKLAYVPGLIERKVSGTERQRLDSAELPFFSQEYDRLRAQLEDEASKTSLPDATTAKPALNDLLIRIRLRTVK